MCVGILLGILTFLVFIQYSRANKLEELLSIELENREKIQKIIEESSEIFRSELSGAFQNDDEVGQFFKNLVRIQDELNLFVKNHIEEEYEEEE